jgi:hypothetical protein
MEGVHIDVIAAPGDVLAARTNLQPGQVGDRPGRSMLAGDPLGVIERQLAGPNGHRHRGFEEAAARLRGVEFQIDGRGGLAGHAVLEKADEQTCQRHDRARLLFHEDASTERTCVSIQSTKPIILAGPWPGAEVLAKRTGGAAPAMHFAKSL